MKCTACGISELTSGDMNGICLSCWNKMQLRELSPPQGWMCPKCGKVFGPSVVECFYCNGGVQVTSTCKNITDCFTGGE